MVTLVPHTGLGVFDVKAYGATGDGVTNDAAAIQSALNAAMTVKGRVIIPPGTYYLGTTTIVIRDPVSIHGQGAVDGHWNETRAAALLVQDDAATGPAIEIGATADSGTTATGFKAVQGVEIHNLLIKPSTSGNGNRGILIDGSDTRYALRGVARDILLKNVAVLNFASSGLHLLGNVFNIRTENSAFRNNGGDNVKLESSTVNLGVNRPGQVFFYDTYFRGRSGVGSGNRCANLQYATLFGGHIEGTEGAYLGANCAIYGTHIEGDETAASIGLHIMGQNIVLFPEVVSRYETLIKIGDGTATQVDGYRGFIPLMQIGTTGIHVTSGGARSGSLEWGNTASLTSDLTDDRGLSNFRSVPLRKNASNQYAVPESQYLGFLRGTTFERYEYGDGTSHFLKSKNASGVDTTRITIADRQNTEEWVWSSARHSQFRIMAGTTANRPASPLSGMLYMDTDLDALIVYDGDNSAWRVLDDRPSATAVTNANYTALDTDKTILVTTGASSRTITLPAASGRSGKEFKIKKVDNGAGTVVIDASGAELIDGAATYTITPQYGAVNLVCDGTGWSVF